MKEKINKYLHDLCCTPGESGHEQLVSDYMKAVFESFGFETTVDVLGNTICKINGTENAKTVLVTAHMDSLGLIVKYITPDGFLKVDRVGGVPIKTLPALHVAVQGRNKAEYFPGIIGVKSHHLTKAAEKNKVDEIDELYVDLGCSSREEVERLGVRVGSSIVYEPSYRRMNENRVYGTSFDNRVACAQLLILAEQFKANPPKATVYLAGTVQEEYTIRGAVTAARATKPDCIICLDVEMACDTPDLIGAGDCKLSGGPNMSLYNFHGRGTLNGDMPHPAMVRLFEDTAEQIGMPLQRAASTGGLTELAYMQVEGNGGIAGIDIETPCRYTHSQIELADLNDMVATTVLVEAAIRNIDANFQIVR